MKVILASSAFKGTLGAEEANSAFQKGLSFLKGAEFLSIPLADGGDDTLSALECLLPDARRIETRTSGPYFNKSIPGFYLRSGRTAYLSVCNTSGLALLPKPDFANTTTYGLGQQIKDAVGRGCDRIYVALGGSSTSDLGLGMMAALGVRFFDEDGKEFLPRSQDLGRLKRIDTRGLSLPKGLSFFVLSDVESPLLGPKGATYAFALQKGAKKEDLDGLEEAMARASHLIERLSGTKPSLPGSGAAGGLGYALLAFLHAKILPGARTILQLSRFEEKVRGASLLVTGEGKIDGTSLYGKALGEVTLLCQEHHVPFLTVSGTIDAKTEATLSERGGRLFLTLGEAPVGEGRGEESKSRIAEKLHEAESAISILFSSSADTL